MKVEVFIKGQRLDLFDDESINLTQGVQDVKDISKLFADYSQSFNVPASKNNNRLFKNYYNADIDNGFDARTRKEAYITINTLPFKVGKIQLDGVKLKDNEPSSYQITFYGNAVKVKDLLGDDKLNDLEWLQNFNHEYDGLKVLDGLANGLDFTVDGVLYEDAIIYPLISYNRQYYYNSDVNDNTSTENLVNIAWKSGRTDGIDFKDLKPAIKLELVVKAIQFKYPDLSFIGGFFESQLFKDIYVNLNKNSGTLANGSLIVENNTFEMPTGNVSNDKIFYSLTVQPKSGFENVEYKVRIKLGDDEIHFSQNWLTGGSGGSAISDVLEGTQEVTFEVVTQGNFEFDAVTKVTHFSFFNGFSDLPTYPRTYNDLEIIINTNINNEIKDIKVYDFLTGLFKTFNLIVEASGEDIIVEDLQSWYMQGRIFDITPYVDTRELEVEKGIIYNDMKFNFKETKQILAERYEDSFGKGFGDEELQLYEDETQERLLDGETLEIKSIFEHPMYERLIDVTTNQPTSVQYMPYLDGDLKPISGNPFMFYANRVNVADNPVGYVREGGVYTVLNAPIYMPTRSRTIDGNDFTLSFYSEFNEYTYSIPQETILSKYWLDYISDIFSVKRRNYKLEAILPTSIIQKLRLNDRLIIGNKRYLINKIQSNLTKRKDKLELLNDIYDAPLASDVLTNSIFSQSGGMYKKEATKDSIQYVGLAEQTPIVVDDKFGTNWVTIDNYGLGSVMTITFSIDENLTGSDRTVIIKIVDGINNPTYTIFQYG